MRHRFRTLAAMFALSAVPAQAALNDTGQTECYDTSNVIADCATVAADGGDRPRQDARFGRDAAFAAGQLTKTGGGAAGFDFTKICMSGEAAGTGDCPADPAVGTDLNEWACTRDNHTNLLWSIEGIYGVDWTAATVTNPASYDSATRCGFDSGWRAPTIQELLSIVHHGKTSSAMIDTDFFPDSPGAYWSSDEYALDTSSAWRVFFGTGGTHFVSKSSSSIVRLVHGGP